MNFEESLENKINSEKAENPADFLAFGRYTDNCPEWILDKVKKIEKEKIDTEFIVNALKSIREEFDSKLHDDVTTTNIFENSRFISVTDVLVRRQNSCGSMATVVASVFRNLGVPTKLVDGMFIKNDPDMQHAWNEFFIDEKWQPYDITRKDFEITPYHVRLGEYVDWGELKSAPSKNINTQE
jgi:hypothetical protein